MNCNILITLLLALAPISSVLADIPADVSLLTIDYKYNDVDGVKICEMQQGLNSGLAGATFLSKKEGIVAQSFCETLSQYNRHVWFCSQGIQQHFIKVFERFPGWKKSKSYYKLVNNKNFIKRTKKAIKNPKRLNDYHGILVALYRYLDVRNLDAMKGAIVLNAAFLPYFGDFTYTDKSTMSSLFEGHPMLEQLKPQWKFYTKEYSQSLVQQILTDFSAPYLVIKPRAGHQGRGVIILHRDDLNTTLQYILTNRQELKKSREKEYNFWADDPHTEFLVEEYVPSNPVKAPHLNEGDFDGTARTLALLAYNEGKIDITFLFHMWKLPKKSLTQMGTLVEKHKSFSGSKEHYAAFNLETTQNVEAQLREGLTILYQRILNQK